MAISETRTSTNNPLGAEYQVFLSFRGLDTRDGFTDTLYKALVNAGIHVFFDNEELPPGERISDSLMRALDDSRLYIPIFSPNYASSYWCLRELAKMVENNFKSREDGNEKEILPIFYNVESDDVKLITQLYSNDIMNLEQMMKDRKKFNDVETWRQALKRVGGISGLNQKNYTSDGDLSKMVVNEVVNRLRTRQRKVTEDLVGMEDQIKAIDNLLDIDSGGVRLIGIYGMGGIGKTTLAKIVFNQLCAHFGKNCSFLDDVSEKVKAMGLVKLQEKLLSDISFSSVAREINNVDEGTKMIGETICNQKVLIVLDDVNEPNQIKELIGMNSLCTGTRILVTTREKRVMEIRGLKYEIAPYEMEGLKNEDALQLFSRHAFGDNAPLANYCALSKDIVSTTGGLPLALRAIGSLLFLRKEKKIWEEILEKLRKTPNKDVLGKLRISYDALEADQQQIFLDVACFFIGENKTNPSYMWKDCGFTPEYAIDVLINRCMIKVLDDNSFWMHDQFRDLGRAIANQENLENPEERTKLWARDDIIDQLRSTEIKGSVQALRLLSGVFIQPTIAVTPEQIKRFPNLRFLWLCNVTCQGDFTGCLSKLRWISLRYPHTVYPFLELERYPRFEATNLHLENVVVLNLFGLGFTEDKVSSLIKGAGKLKVLTFQKSWHMCTTPNFSGCPVLEKLTISECPYLLEIDCSIGKLRWLTDLSVESCQALGELPEQIGELRHLLHLSLRNCGSLSELPDSISKLESLTKLDVSHTGITRLPNSIGRLLSLSSLNASHTPIVTMPETVSKLPHLETLDLVQCNEIQELPKLPRSLATLRLLSSSLQTVPKLSNLTNIVELLLSDRFELKATLNTIQPFAFRWMGGLSKLQCLRLLNAPALPTELGSLSLLKELTLCGLDLQTLEQLPSNLTVLELHSTCMKQVPLDGLPQLEKLTVEGCQLLERLSIPSSLIKLREALVSSCTELVEVQFLGVLKSLERLHIENCKSLERLVCNESQAPEWTYGLRRVSLVSSSLKMLQEFQLSRCPKLQEIQFVSMLESLERFSVEGCSSLKRLGHLSNLKNLKELCMEGCESLQVLEGIDELEFLHRLKVNGCGSMDRIIEASSSKLPNECQIASDSSINCEPFLAKMLNLIILALNSEGDTLSEQFNEVFLSPVRERVRQNPYLGTTPEDIDNAVRGRPPPWANVHPPDDLSSKGASLATMSIPEPIDTMLTTFGSTSHHHQPNVLGRSKAWFTSILQCICKPFKCFHS